MLPSQTSSETSGRCSAGEHPDCRTPVPADAEATADRGHAQRAILALIRGYQLAFAPMYSGSCRFVPSCSAYAAEAVERHGAMRGTLLAARRLLRCHPFGSHGLDPVPPASAPSASRRGKPAAVPQENSL